MIFIWLTIFLVLLNEGTLAELSCKTENGDRVDWFVAFKYPNSYDFVYFDENTKSNNWKIPEYSLENESNMIGKTIDQAYQDRDSDRFYAFYNDEGPDDQSNSYRGHLKGIVNFDENSGYWLIHSVPKFPETDGYYYGEGQSKYGQSFVCVSLKSSNLKNIAYQLLMMQATVYSSYVPENFMNDAKLVDLLDKLSKNSRFKRPLSKVLKMSTFEGFEFMHMGKSRKFNDDLYSALVAPTLKASIYVESWIRGSRVDTNCDLDYNVYNVEDLKLIDVEYTETKDHSKWVVSEDSEYVCIGDINRMESQFDRGGGTLCLKHNKLGSLMNKLVKDVEPCPRKKVLDTVIE